MKIKSITVVSDGCDAHAIIRYFNGPTQVVDALECCIGQLINDSGLTLRLSHISYGDEFYFYE